jgi:hypothetical protein
MDEITLGTDMCDPLEQQTMRHMVNGMEINVPTESDGRIDSDVLRRMSGIDDSRPLILKRCDGSNEVINPGEKIKVNPDQYFQDMPLHTRGAR